MSQGISCFETPFCSNPECELHHFPADSKTATVRKQDRIRGGTREVGRHEFMIRPPGIWPYRIQLCEGCASAVGMVLQTDGVADPLLPNIAACLKDPALRTALEHRARMLWNARQKAARGEVAPGRIIQSGEPAP